MKPIFERDKKKALELAKRHSGSFVIFSKAPGESGPHSDDWGYWIEEEPGMIRTWEKIIYDPEIGEIKD
jgi:hypothetical protein